MGVEDSPAGPVADFLVRPGWPEDEPERAALLERAFQTLRGVYRPSDSARARRALDSRGYRVLVGELDERIVASLEYRRDGDCLHLRALAVDPELRRRGLARQLLGALAGLARESRAETLSLYTIRETGNVELFERLGFEVVGESLADWCESERFESLHEVRMERRLG